MGNFRNFSQFMISEDLTRFSDEKYKYTTKNNFEIYDK